MLAQKRALLADSDSGSVRARADSLEAQREVLDLVVAHLTTTHADRYRAVEGGIEIVGTDRIEPLDADRPPLEIAARLVQEDLVLMRQSPDGYRLVAGVVCFPSSWRLDEKFDRPMMAIHDSVPGWDGALGQRVDRIMAHLKTDLPVTRFGWSLYPDDRLRHLDAIRPPGDWMADPDDAARSFFRVERQTLRRLPRTGDVLFTIRIHLDPFTSLEAVPEGPAIASKLVDQLRELSDDQLRYKGIHEARDRLIRWFAGLAAQDVAVSAEAGGA